MLGKKGSFLLLCFCLKFREQLIPGDSNFVDKKTNLRHFAGFLKLIVLLHRLCADLPVRLATVFSEDRRIPL